MKKTRKISPKSSDKWHKHAKKSSLNSSRIEGYRRPSKSVRNKARKIIKELYNES
ncbi:MAG: hypothetical protein R6U31_06695 [bacterium]